MSLSTNHYTFTPLHRSFSGLLPLLKFHIFIPYANPQAVNIIEDLQVHKFAPFQIYFNQKQFYFQA